VCLEVPATRSAGDALKSVKEQLRSIPRRGIGYGVLRYLGQDADASRLAALPRAQVRFNYLGQFDPWLATSALFAPASEATGPAFSPRSRRTHMLDIAGSVVDGQLSFLWLYGEGLHDSATIERLADAFVERLRAILAHCRRPEAGGYTPSDFPSAKLSRRGLDTLLAKLAKSHGARES
jgi:non-ribosomal peptide synthase protein (TIGR01720 family)